MTAADLNADTIGRKLLTEFRDMPDWKRDLAAVLVDNMKHDLFRYYWHADEIIADTRNALTALRETEDVQG